MKNESLPWDVVSGPKYSARDLNPRKKWVTVCCWFMSGLLILGGLITPYRIASVFGVLYILALMMKKDTVITKRGVEIYYQMHITTHYDFWSWADIGSVVREDRNHRELIALHISNGDRVKRLFFTRPDAEKIITLAKAQNHKIVVGNADETQMIGYKKDSSKKTKTKKKK